MSGTGSKDVRLNEVQREVDDVTNLMRNNLEKTLQRGEQLEELDDKSTRLEDNARNFQKRANKVHWLYRCRSYRNMAIIVVLLIIILVIILWLAGAFDSDDDSSSSDGGGGSGKELVSHVAARLARLAGRGGAGGGASV